MTSISELLRTARQQLPESPSAPYDAELLLMHSLQCTRSFLYAHATDNPTDDQCAQFSSLISQRAQGVPVAYLTGQREFWSLPLQVSPATLIPRPETELLVEVALDTYKGRQFVNLLDLGCGSGAIALALAHSRPGWSITASDSSVEALAIAQNNARALNLTTIHWLESDWFNAIPQQLFDGILSNPPYLAWNDSHLEEGDVRYEPRSALVSGPDGLEALQQIILNAPNYLRAGGYLLLEHGYNQAETVAALLIARGFHTITCFHDLQGHPRVTQAMTGR